MAFISGRRAKPCNVATFDDGGRLTGSCRSTEFVLISESFDAIDHVIVGEERCAQCAAAFLFTRRPTPEELAANQGDTADRPLRSTDKGRFMFRANTPLSLRGIYPTTETIDGETRKRVVLEFFIQPFTQALAQSIDVAQNLFTRTDGEPIDDIVNCELAIVVALQQMTLRMAADSPGGRTFSDVRVSKTIKVRRDKEGPVLAATFKVDFAYPSPDDLLYLFTGYLDQHYVTFETQQGSLGLGKGDEAPPPPQKKPRGRGKTTDAPPPDAPPDDTGPEPSTNNEPDAARTDPPQQQQPQQ